MKNKLKNHILPFFLAILAWNTSYANSTSYSIQGMSCQACVKSVTAQVCKLPGIKTCEVEVGKVKISTIEGSKISRQQIEEAVNKANKKFTITDEQKN